MANDDHVAALKKGSQYWNEWREVAGVLIPDFSNADLSNLDLKKAQLMRADFYKCGLQNTNFGRANLTGARFNNANAQNANFRNAVLLNAALSGTALTNSDFRGAWIGDTTFTGSDMHGVKLDGATIGLSTFADIDLSKTEGLDSVYIQAPCSIGVDTLYRSQGRIPEKFLRDAGISEDVIQHLLPLIRCLEPINWHSCFISYSAKDEEFARRLHSRMRQENMRVWFAPEDLKGGQKLHEQLYGAIQLYDRLLLVLSEHSVQSEWVATEIRKAREVEKKEKRRKLFPIRLCDFGTLRGWECFDADSGKDLAVEVREYFTPDFSNWTDHDSFEAAFSKLQKDLRSADKS